VPDIAIKDVYLLGKFKPGQQHTKLVEFLHILDAEAILSNRNKLSPPVLSKPDVTPKKLLLLKER